MSKKRVRGLFDIVSLADGEEWELEPNSENFVVGMGWVRQKMQPAGHTKAFA
jgi:hypothetical protein